MEWQPIATAPEDGTVVLLFSPRNGAGSGSWYSRTFQRWEGVDDTTQKLVRVNDPSKWHSTSEEGSDMGRPTHWMPLPPSPRATL